MNAREAIEKAKERLKMKQPDVAIGFLYGLPEVKDAGLWELVYDLDHAYYNCTKGDVEGVIELLEKYLDEQQTSSKS